VGKMLVLLSGLAALVDMNHGSWFQLVRNQTKTNQGTYVLEKNKNKRLKSGLTGG